MAPFGRGRLGYSNRIGTERPSTFFLNTHRPAGFTGSVFDGFALGIDSGGSVGALARTGHRAKNI
jgi:hypothetical protein